MSTVHPPEPRAGGPAVAFEGLLLAGGQSRRMGRDKAGLEWHGRSLREHMAGLLRRAGAARVRCSGPFAGPDALHDVEPGLGPLGGLLSLARSAADGAQLVVPVDMPLLDENLLQTLAGALDRSARAACFAGFPLPLGLWLDADSRALIEGVARQARAQRSVRALHRALGGVELPLPRGAEPRLGNCNTPEQWRELLAAAEAHA